MTTARVQDELDVVGDLVSSLEENAERVAQGCDEAYERAGPKTKVSAKGGARVVRGDAARARAWPGGALRGRRRDGRGAA